MRRTHVFNNLLAPISKILVKYSLASHLGPLADLAGEATANKIKDIGGKLDEKDLRRQLEKPGQEIIKQVGVFVVAQYPHVKPDWLEQELTLAKAAAV